ncbi:MerR family transcriptional regulator [Actinomadura sp. DC4]|uniref:MerR family transcriptional regulator n=1 Tax=Actinomadura sp. DC4 TaxID=3055069 RepID=UPI0025B23217|nr:MerR family transcriptional regulator [Actinomadura sp. DC4]MDN3353151.1 MerR family transcriptional regulator [Actinomadura sp. DC4]
MAVYFSPGEAVRRTGLSLDTLRYYERIGLLDRIERDQSGHRRFEERDLAWLGVLICLRETGMPIAQMSHYAELVRRGEGTIAERVALLAEHDAQVDRQIETLRAQQAHLRQKIATYKKMLPEAEA